ncbi:MAG TPA: tetratricopeptide repeat protein [Nevskiaceae bacterium]|nr:tetratricopeptide repeat protein [Nevskiaceae bacterium]
MSGTRRRMSVQSLRGCALAGALLTLAACTPAVVRQSAPPIGTIIGHQAQPAANVLPITPSAPVAANPQKAIANYQALLALHPDKQLRDEALRRIADLQVQTQDIEGNPASGRATLEQSIDTYRALLAQHPHAADNDRLLYQLARAYHNTGQTAKAIQTLKRLETRHPGSDLMGDTHFRSAELLFQTKQYAAAAKQYRIVMDLGPKAPFYQPAQYKYGWSLFKQHKYDQDIAVFFSILDTDLPPGKLEDPDKALAQVEKGRSDIAKDSLRVVDLSFVELGGGAAINAYFAKHGQPRFYELVYNSLGATFLAHKRYTDAAKTYAAFIERYPSHREAPHFQDKVIAAYRAGGFNDQVLTAAEAYANDYAPGASYWGGKAPTTAVMKHLHADFEAIGHHYQAAGARAGQTAEQQSADYANAAHWYRRFQTVFPTDPDAPNISMSLGDSLYAGGQTRQAAYVYEKTAYAYPGFKQAPAAALAAVQAWQRLAKEVPPAQRPAVLELSVRSSDKLAAVFPHHPKRDAVLTGAAVDLLELKQYNQATAEAERVLAAQPTAAPQLRQTALGVVGDARFAQDDYPKAERAYTQMLALTPSNDPQRPRVVKQLALSIYRQGVGQRKLGNLRLAADDFLRIGKVVPEAELWPTADFDAGAALVEAHDWQRAEQVLSAFRTQFPNNKLVPDVDKKLALSYQSDHQPAKAAAVYLRIANRSSETPDTRRNAAWLAARLFDQAHQFSNAQGAYENYVGQYPLPLDQAMDARARLAELAKAQHDTSNYQYWLEQIVQADQNAGAQRDDKSRILASHASLLLARMTIKYADSIILNQPLKDSLSARTLATQTAVTELKQTLTYGVAEDTTAATYELGALYADFAQALMNSQRPAVTGDELAQYNLVLQEKSEPFVDEAIKAHKANLARVGQGMYDKWIAKSVAALARLAPGTYAKQEKGKLSYEHLH